MNIKDKIQNLLEIGTYDEERYGPNLNVEDELKTNLNMNESSILNDVIQFIKNNPNPKDADLHKWAEKKKYNIHEVETLIYRLAIEYVDFLTNGKSVENNVTENDVNKEEFKMGLEVEKEHAKSINIRARITLDHLAETNPPKDSKYYTYLKEMEMK